MHAVILVFDLNRPTLVYAVSGANLYLFSQACDNGRIFSFCSNGPTRLWSCWMLESSTIARPVGCFRD